MLSSLLTELPSDKCPFCPINFLAKYQSRAVSRPFCSFLDQQRPDVSVNLTPRYSDRIAFPNVVAAAKSGCKGSHVMKFAVRSLLKDLDDQTTEVRFCRNERAQIMCEVFGHLNKRHWIEVNMIPTEEPACVSWPRSLPSVGMISSHTGSKQAIQAARSWLYTCITKHVCYKTSNSTLPRRVLCIDGPSQVRLHISQGEMAPYACLSHCWGKSPSLLKTTTATLEEFQTRILWDKLPATFQDAIYFTHKLGVKYIWIDSLCIVQDSTEDWRHEGSVMANIYESALVTLAATKAPNSESGCFSVPNQEYRSHVMEMAATEVGRVGASIEIHARVPLPHRGMQGIKALQDTPLLDRAWVYQERKLSPRVVYFNQHELAWECHSAHWCECSSPYELFDPNQMLGKLGIEAFSDQLKWQAEWQRIVTEYTGKSLTYSKDIFPALQGLAKKGPDFMGKYLAGLWETTLLFSLTWFRRHFGPKRSRPQPWRAPTWSWASIDGNVYFDRQEYRFPQTFVTIQSVTTTPVGDDPTGELFAGVLMLKGKCLVGKYEGHSYYLEDRHSIRVYGRHRSVPESFADHYVGYLSSSYQGNDDCLIKSRIYIDYDIQCPGPYHVSVGSEVLLMKINETVQPLISDGESRIESWLILRVIKAERQICERIGVVRLQYWMEEKPEMDELYKECSKEMTVTIV